MRWDERTQGGGVGPTVYRPVVVIAEQNLRCYESDVFSYEDILVHEFSHGILNMGIERMHGGGEFRERLESAYSNALDGGLWERTYAGDNPDEYWAEGVQAWFGLNDPPGPIHNNINTRAELESYDPVLAGLTRKEYSRFGYPLGPSPWISTPVLPDAAFGMTARGASLQTELRRKV